MLELYLLTCEKSIPNFLTNIFKYSYLNFSKNFCYCHVKFQNWSKFCLIHILFKRKTERVEFKAREGHPAGPHRQIERWDELRLMIFMYLSWIMKRIWNTVSNLTLTTLVILSDIFKHNSCYFFVPYTEVLRSGGLDSENGSPKNESVGINTHNFSLYIII